jgi:hypothetical protein
MKRWSKQLKKYVEHPKADEFLKDIETVCIRHGLSIGHEDTNGAFVLETYDKEIAPWLEEACLGKTIDCGVWID